MARLLLSKQNTIESFTLILQDKNFENIINITNASEIKYKENYNSADEISFTVNKYVNGIKCNSWDSIVDFKTLYVPELDERFEITVSKSESNSVIKEISGISLCEAELSQVNLYDIEINTDNDIVDDSYDENFPTILYRDLDIGLYDWNDAKFNGKYSEYTDEEKLSVLKRGSLLHRILEKASNYSIEYVQESLKKITDIKTFSIDDSSIYDELIGEISEEYGVIFKFDSMNRKISVFDLYNTCNKCGYRGDFSSECPECESSDFGGQDGEDTTIFISSQNLASDIQLDCDSSSIKNCFRIKGGDDEITSDVRNVNPNGSDYIYSFNEKVYEDMPDDLVEVLKKYNEEFYNFQTTHEYSIDSETLNNFNSVVSYIKTYFEDTEFNYITSPIVGYKNLMNVYYNIVDIDLFINTSMMPTVVTDDQTIDDAINLLTVKNMSPIAVYSPSTILSSNADSAVINMAKVLVNTALYDVSVSYSSYTKGSTGKWVGKIKLSSIADETETRESSELTLVFNNDQLTYIQQQIAKEMNKSELDEAIDITNINIEDNVFKERLHLYGVDSLIMLNEEFLSCLNIILDSKADFDDAVYNQVYNLYSKKKSYIDDELELRNTQAFYIQELYEYLIKLIQNTKTALNLQTYVGEDLWKVFCCYRRESKYQNDNYTSDSLNNAERLQRAEELYKKATKELYKASHPQYTLTSTINNLLCIKEFYPLIENFECGNWIRIEIDDEIYPLRLLSYEIDFDNTDQISVEFSTVEKLYNGRSDIESVIKNANSISGSYSNTMHQVKQSSEAADIIYDWVKDGFYATTKIINSPYSQNIVIDKNGILCRQYDDISDKFNDCQLKIIGSGLYITDDGWLSVKSAIGRYVYIDNTGNEHTAMGVLADTIVGRFILGENLGIYNNDNSLIFNQDGLVISNGINDFSVNPNNTSKLLKLSKSGETDILYVNSNGDLFISGTITAGSGSKIGNLNVGENKLTYGNFGIDTSSVSSTNTTLWLGSSVASSAPFRVTYGGAVTATNITATGGKIANWTITGNRIESDKTVSGGYRSGIQSLGENTSAAFYAGTTTPAGGKIANKDSSAFFVTQEGKLFASKATIAGVFNAESIKVKQSYYIYDDDVEENVKIISCSLDNTSDTKYNFGRLTDNGYKSGLNYISFIDESQERSIKFVTSSVIMTDLLVDNIYIGDNGDYCLTSNGHVYANNIYVLGNKLRFEANYSTPISIGSNWKDGNYHDILACSNDGLTTGIGWNGKNDSNASYSTVLNLRGKTVKAPNVGGVTITSDERLKNSFDTLDNFDDIYMALKPISFKYNNGSSDRRHFGFGANQVKSAIENCGFTTKDFAGFVQMENNSEDEDYCGLKDPMGLIYTEFIAWNTHMIQKLYKENEVLKQRIKILEQAM